MYSALRLEVLYHCYICAELIYKTPPRAAQIFLLRGFPMKAILITTVSAKLHQSSTSKILWAPYTCLSLSLCMNIRCVLLVLEMVTLHGTGPNTDIQHAQAMFSAFSKAGQDLILSVNILWLSVLLMPAKRRYASKPFIQHTLFSASSAGNQHMVLSFSFLTDIC